MWTLYRAVLKKRTRQHIVGRPFVTINLGKELGTSCSRRPHFTGGRDVTRAVFCPSANNRVNMAIRGK